MIRVVYIGMSVLLASAPMLPVYADRQSLFYTTEEEAKKEKEIIGGVVGAIGGAAVLAGLALGASTIHQRLQKSKQKTAAKDSVEPSAHESPSAHGGSSLHLSGTSRVCEHILN